jgi:biotin--[acetyl-coA-carboxylase] ligase
MLKEEVLKLLKSSSEYISGQTICDTLGVSRTAIWKTVNSLKEEGYNIQAGSNKGYKLISSEEALNKFELEEELRSNNIPIKFIFEDSVDSTNLLAKRLADEYVSTDVLVVADEQTAGRGRRGRTWSSPKGTGIWMSLLLHPPLGSEKASMITLLAALALVRVLKRTLKEVGIKWPNDIVVSKKKLCGILTEMSADMDGIKYVVCGMGINVNTKSFPKELEETASSLFIETHRTYSRKEIIRDFLKEFYELYFKFTEVGDLSYVLDEYNSYLLGVGENITVFEAYTSYQAEQGKINKNGQLSIIDERGEKRALIGGEISIRGMYTYK